VLRMVRADGLAASAPTRKRPAAAAQKSRARRV